MIIKHYVYLKQNISVTKLGKLSRICQLLLFTKANQEEASSILSFPTETIIDEALNKSSEKIHDKIVANDSIIARIYQGENEHQFILRQTDEALDSLVKHHPLNKCPIIYTTSDDRDPNNSPLYWYTPLSTENNGTMGAVGKYYFDPYVAALMKCIKHYDFKHRPLYLEATITECGKIHLTDLTYPILREFFLGYLNIEYGDTFDPRMTIVFSSEGRAKAALTTVNSLFMSDDDYHIDPMTRMDKHIIKIDPSKFPQIIEAAVTKYHELQISRDELPRNASPSLSIRRDDYHKAMSNGHTLNRSKGSPNPSNGGMVFKPGFTLESMLGHQKKTNEDSSKEIGKKDSTPDTLKGSLSSEEDSDSECMFKMDD